MHIFQFPPDPEVLARLDAIDQQLALIVSNQETTMALEDDLNNAVTSLATGYSALHDAVQIETDALTKAMSTIPQPADPAVAAKITASIANITAITGKMATDAASLTSKVPAATPVPPPVVVTPVTPPTVTVPVIATPPVTDPSATPPSTPPASATTK
jgi:hypothetical protein